MMLYISFAVALIVGFCLGMALAIVVGLALLIYKVFSTLSNW
jgi:hypothetical protein